jgi:cholecystokinin A receptor/hypocretin (orexin) receptor 2
MCIPNTILLKKSFIDVYQKIYAGLYLISFLIVLVLYGLIYRSIHIRRALKAKRKRSSLFPAAPNDYSAVDTQMTILNNGNEVDGKDENGQKRFRKKSLGLKDKVFYANIRTAVMLFIVTIVFLIAFLPAWLMAHELVTYNMIVFYMYFIYNVANPIIYAFMNNSFRDDLQNIFKRKCNAK